MQKPKKAEKDELKKQKLLKTTISASQASKCVCCMLLTFIVIIYVQLHLKKLYLIFHNNFKGTIISF